MWLFTRYGFFSVACAYGSDGTIDSQMLMVRGRRAAHLRNLIERFPSLAGIEIVTLQDRDYRYRIFLAKTIWAEIVGELVKEQDWSNFKNEAAEYQDGSDLGATIHALHRVWSVMNDLQLRESRGRTWSNFPQRARCALRQCGSWWAV